MYDCGCDTCKAENTNLNLADSAYFKKVLNAGKKAFKHLAEKGSYSPEDINEKPYRELIQATYEVFNTTITDNVISPTLKRALQNDAFLFGGLKTHAQLFEASKLLLDENGNIKSVTKLQEELDKLNVEYNRNYLEAEYQFAVQSSLSADQWERSSERYNLQYRTASDDRVREEHKALHGITLPKDDPFWMEYYPPNGWRCRCRAIQVRKEKYPESNSEEALNKGDRATTQIGKDGKNRLEIFRFNPGVRLKLMPPEHPYNKVQGTDAIKENLKTPQQINQEAIEEKLGVKKGEEMSFDDANELRGNINYENGYGYKINCQSCVVSNELRRRGYNVTAMENTGKIGNIPYQLSRKTNWAWLNENGEMPKKTRVGGQITDNRGRAKSKSIQQLSTELNDVTKEIGRYHIDFCWKGRNSGHIITLERLDNGLLRFYDPQNGKRVRWADLSNQISPSYGVNVLRVDNLQVNTEIINGIVTKLH